MHHHCEIIMPPTNDVVADIDTILRPFDYGIEDANVPFWDFWRVGGRWSGAKIEETLGEDRIKAFFDELEYRGVTVSGINVGKQTLKPDSQIPMVDALFKEHFPEAGVDKCIFFDHAAVEHHNALHTLPKDICLLSECPLGLSCARLIVASKFKYGDPDIPSRLEAIYMISTHVYNGVLYLDMPWDSTVRQGLELAEKHAKRRYNTTFYEQAIPKDDWLCVTVDYHS